MPTQIKSHRLHDVRPNEDLSSGACFISQDDGAQCKSSSAPTHMYRLWIGLAHMCPNARIRWATPIQMSRSLSKQVFVLKTKCRGFWGFFFSISIKFVVVAATLHIVVHFQIPTSTCQAHLTSRKSQNCRKNLPALICYLPKTFQILYCVLR